LAELPESDCRYGVFDVKYEDPKTQNDRNKLTFFAWYTCPGVHAQTLSNVACLV
jgi:hypothetical protein